MKKPIYSPQQIFAASFFGGPISAVYFLHRNFKSLENSAGANSTLLWGAAFNVILVAVMPFLPDRFPNIVLPLTYSLAARGIAESKQLSKTAISASDLFTFQPNWKVLGLSAAFLVGTCVLWLSILAPLIHFNIINVP